MPSQGRPADFSGAVGEFDFSVSASKTELKATESLQAVVEVKGKGNLKLFQLPEPNLPGSLEVYEPEFDVNVRTSLSGMKGSVSNNYTIVPSYRGKYPIPTISFSYFNPKTGRYNTLTSEEIMINVLEGPTAGGISASTLSSSNKQSVVSTGMQFNFIKLESDLQAIGSQYFFASPKFYAWLFSPLLLIPLFILFGKRREAIASDEIGNRIKRANKLARKFLSTAKRNLGNKEDFYIALEKALHNYLKAKLKIETSEFSKEKISDLLNERQINEATIEGFIGLLQNCEMARYSPFSEVRMQQDYKKASEVISSIDKRI